MTEKEKNLFDQRFYGDNKFTKGFINKLKDLFKLKLLGEKEIEEYIKQPHPEHCINKDYYYEMLYKRVDKLISLGLNVNESISFVFTPLEEILTIRRMNKWRKKTMEKYFLEVIKYF